MHLLVLPGWLSNKWEENPASGVFFLNQADIMRQFGGHKINVFYPQVASVFGHWRRRKTLPPCRGLDIKPHNGMEVWIDYRPRWIGGRKRAIHAVINDNWGRYVQRHGKPDILWVQSAVGPGVVAARHLLATQGVPYFIVEHSARFLFPLSTAARCRYQEMLTAAAFVATVSGLLKEALVPIHNNIAVLHNPLSSAFMQDGTNNKAANAAFMFYSVGRLEKNKGHETVIDAFALLINDGVDCRLTIVGDGALKHKLQERVNAAGVADKIKFAGFVTPDELPKHLRRADAYVSASEHETFNLSLAEALAIGLPCVATPTGIAAEVINEKTGVIAAGFDQQVVADAMRTVVHTKYDHARIAAQARALFSPQQYVSTLNDLINQHVTLCANPRCES